MQTGATSEQATPSLTHKYAQSCKDTRLGEIYTSLHWFHLPVKTFHFYAAEPFQMCYGVELQSCVRSLAAFKLREDKSNA